MRLRSGANIVPERSLRRLRCRRYGSTVITPRIPIARCGVQWKG